MSEDLPTQPKKPIPPTHPQAAMSSQNLVDALNAKQKTNACNKPKTSTGASKVHGDEQVETRAGKGLENDTQLRYTATLSTIFTSFSGIATKKEYRSAFWHALLVGMFVNALTLLIWFPFCDNELIATIILILGEILCIIFIWDDIKTQVKRFHAFGMSFTMYWIIPVLVVVTLAYGAILTVVQTGRPDMYLTARFMPVIIAVYGGILTIILFFGNASCDKGTSLREACIAFMTKKRKVNKKLCVTCGIVILCGLLFLCYYLSPTQRASRELRGRGVSDFSYRIIKENDVETIQLLIAAGADVNEAEWRGETPLYKAAEEDHTEKVKLLIAAGADVNKADEDGKTPLHRAAENGHTETVKLLIAAGADVNKADKYGKTPLHRAAEEGHTEIVDLLRAVELLRAAEANRESLNRVDYEKQTLLYKAAEKGNIEIAKLLIAAGADVNKADEDGKTPLHRAAENGHTETVKLLIAAGADVNKAEKYGKTPLHRAADHGYTEIVKLLIAAGADVNKADKTGWTPLKIASFERRTKTVELLKAAGAKE